MGKIYVFDHPLIQHKTALMRKKETKPKDFRSLVGEIASLMTYEAARDLPLVDVEIETPMEKTTLKMLKGADMAIVPILRAGLGMVDGMLSILPQAKVGHIGLYRDPDTHKPVEYYCKLPADIEDRLVIVVDPMLATGGSAIDAITRIKDLAFYLWAIALSLAIAVTAKAIDHSHEALWEYIGIAIISAVCCLVQFVIGRIIGRHHGDRIAGAQSLGQKNTAFAIWMAYTFMNPVTALAGGFYSVWHNVFNSYQLWKARKPNPTI